MGRRPVFANKKIAIVTHFYTTGPATRLEQYLIDQKISQLNFLAHPFPFSQKTASFVRNYQRGKLVRSYSYFPMRGPELLFYLRDVLLTIHWGLTSPKSDLLICFDGLNTFSGYFLKLLKRTDRIVFYTIDYVPQRFANKFLNGLYHYLDKFGVVYADIVWNVSTEIVSERERRGFSPSLREKQITVPITIESLPITKKTRSYKKLSIIFLGHLRKNQGLEKLLQAMKLVKQKLPGTTLTIVGGGPLQKNLENLIRKYKLSRVVHMTGFIENFSEVEKLLSRHAVAVAPYDNNATTFTKFADPAKPKDYLAHGLPVVITNVPPIAKMIHDKKAGLMVEDDQALSEALIYLLTTKKYNIYSKNAISFARSFTAANVFYRAIEKTLSKKHVKEQK